MPLSCLTCERRQGPVLSVCVCVCVAGVEGSQGYQERKEEEGEKKNENEGSFLKEMGRKIWGMEDRS